jgi:tetratricopeptide (TPR) repeat protein
VLSWGTSSGGTASKAAFAVVLFSLVLLFGAWAPPALAAADPDLDQARALLKANRPADAYAYLEPFEDAQAGNPDFDYVFGLAALDSGKADRATLALERVLAVQPNFAGARIDMARAYFALGDLTRSREEFRAVLAQNPPPAARSVIERYLQAIEERETAKRTLLTGFVELTLGHDSNVNNSTSQTEVAVPALGNLVFTLDPTNVKRSDGYSTVSAGAEVSHALTPGIGVFAGAGGRYRANATEERFDTNSIDGRVGVALPGQRTLFRAMLQGERFYLDHEANRTTRGIAADARYMLNPATFLTGFAAKSAYRFEAPSLDVNDFDQVLAGLGVIRLFHEGRSALAATLLGGKENDIHGRADGDKDILGLRIGGNLNVLESLDLFASVGGQRGDYARENAAFQVTREDEQLDAVVGLAWRLSRAWSLRPQVLYVRNDSNIPIYSYKRTDASLTLRYDFK